MNYLCCPVACVTQHIRWLIQLCHNLRNQSSQEEERWTLLEENSQDLNLPSRSSPLFFRVIPADTIETTPSLSPVSAVFKN